ncbi:SGNH/GDSL hydrolase family protein [bacterium]|nr:SGNH/GDSL hydrolase family protein [bacterium]
MILREVRVQRLFWFRLPRRLLAMVFGFALGVVAAEIAVRLFALDIRVAETLMYYQDVDKSVHMADPDPRLFFRLKPGAVYEHEVPKYRVTVNRHGARGTEYTAVKPPGVFRIAALGGSNVYGAQLDDNETWPARLDQRLNADEPGRFEVWNFGISAYNQEQMGVLGREVLDRFEPDLVIFAPSNANGNAMLPGTDLGPYIERDPEIMTRLIRAFGRIDGYRYPTPRQMRLMERIRLYRLAIFGFTRFHDRGWDDDPLHQINGVKEYDRLVRAARGRARLVLFFCPAAHRHLFTDYLHHPDIPVYDLSADDMPDEYRNIHPPDYVMVWYAEHVATWLRDQGLLAPSEAP